MSDSPHFFSYVAIVIAFVSLVGLVTVIITDKDNPQVQANQDNIDFLIGAHKITSDALGETINRSANNTDKILALENYDEVITTQIGDIRLDIKSKFPQAADVIDPGQTSVTLTSPFLSLKMDKTEFVLGNVVIFTGTAHPNDSIQITIKDSDRMLIPIVVSKTMIIDGSYTANYTLRLDDPIGTWQVYARQQSDQTKTLSFTVE